MTAEDRMAWAWKRILAAGVICVAAVAFLFWAALKAIGLL